MKHRKVFQQPGQLPPVPDPAPGSEEAQFAATIAACVNQGMPGDVFAQLLQIQHLEALTAAANMTPDECIAWFTKDPAAKAIFDATPNFQPFARAFHAEALRLIHPRGIKL